MVLPCITNNTLFFKRKSLVNVQFKYALKFMSLIAPGTLTNLSLLTNQNLTNNKHKKLLVKQSYILLIWLMYLQGTYSQLKDNQKTPSFFIHKKLQFKTTKLKTPMAHKTFSQEQFLLKSYTLSISFKSRQSFETYPQSLNQSIFAVLSLRKNTPFFTTNLLFLKAFKFTLRSKDITFMTLI